jgi:hypothetical protein
MLELLSECDIGPWREHQIEHFSRRSEDVVDAVLGAVDHLNILQEIRRSLPNYQNPTSLARLIRGSVG